MNELVLEERLGRIEGKVDDVGKQLTSLAISVARTEGERRAGRQWLHGLTATISAAVASIVTHLLHVHK